MEVGEEWNGKEAACDRSLVKKLNGEATTSFSGRQMGREEAGGLRKESFKSRVVWLIFVRDV
jgi:hypothetical protein